ncbi:MAG: hypothetical protein ACRC5V_11560 [Aeromonas sp.]
MHTRSEQMADYMSERLAFFTFLTCCSALLGLLTGMSGQQALAFSALNLPVGLVILLAMAWLAPLPARWQLPGISLVLITCALITAQLGGHWLNPLALWGLYALLGFEIFWQARRIDN